MITFKQYINEMAFEQVRPENDEPVFQAIKKLGAAPLLWRGQTAGRRIGQRVIHYSGVVYVINDRDNWKGAFHHDNRPKKVIEGLKLETNPIFCSFDKSQAKFFGLTGIIVPIGNFRIFWNDKVHDVATHFLDDDLDFNNSYIRELVKGYQSSNSIEQKHSGEIILDVKSYYWITVDKYFEFAKKSKFNKFKSIDDVKTYNDVYELYKTYKSYLTWLKGKNNEQFQSNT